MKKLLIPILVFSLHSAYASIEFEGDEQQPTSKEITKNRACFEELARNGCGDPGEDVKQFRSCLKNVHSTLSPDCQQLMNYLYSPRS